MSQQDDRLRTRRERIERLRIRLRAAGDVSALKVVLQAVLDLLADEL